MALSPNERYKQLKKQSALKLDKLVISRTGNKMNAKGTYYNGDFYHSTGERDYAVKLDLRKRAKDILDWKRQVKIDLSVNGTHITNYYCDFLVTHNDGSLEYIEYKGYITEVYKIKEKLLQALKDEVIPGAKFTVVKHVSKYNPWKKVR
jgi:hypothetical protein